MNALRRWTDILGLPVLAAVLVLAVAVLPSSSSDQGSTRRVKVTQSTYACPSDDDTTRALGQIKAGTERRLLARRSGEPTSSGADRWSVVTPGGAGSIVVQDGSGSGAVGFYASVAGASGGGGLSVGHCPGVADDEWFLGLGSADKRSSTLVLMNMSDTPAVADVSLWNSQGVVDAVHAKGISVKPFAVRRIAVSDLAAGEPGMALRLERQRGLLSAVVQDSSTATFAGTEPIEGSLSPRRDQLIPGIDGGARGKTLLLLNPGRQTARVAVSTFSAEGPLAAEGLQDVKVKPGRYRELTVPATAGGGRQAWHVTSDQPVAAAVRVSADPKDFAVAESGSVLDGPAVVPVELGPDVSKPRLLLTAPGEATTATVVAYDARMRELGRTDVEIGARTTERMKTASVVDDDTIAYLVVVPAGRAPVVGAATYTDGDRVTSMRLISAPTTIEVPVVRPD